MEQIFQHNKIRNTFLGASSNKCIRHIDQTYEPGSPNVNYEKNMPDNHPNKLISHICANTGKGNLNVYRPEALAAWIMNNLQ